MIMLIGYSAYNKKALIEYCVCGTGSSGDGGRRW